MWALVVEAGSSELVFLTAKPDAPLLQQILYPPIGLSYIFQKILSSVVCMTTVCQELLFVRPAFFCVPVL